MISKISSNYIKFVLTACKENTSNILVFDMVNDSSINEYPTFSIFFTYSVIPWLCWLGIPSIACHMLTNLLFTRGSWLLCSWTNLVFNLNCYVSCNPLTSHSRCYLSYRRATIISTGRCLFDRFPLKFSVSFCVCTV